MRPHNDPAQLREGPPQLAQHLLSAVGSPLMHVVAGLLLGLALAHGARRRRLHWGWALLAVAIVATVRPGLGVAGFTALLATGAATLRLRRWHREDILAGEDLAAAARLRRSPGAVLRSCLGAALEALSAAPSFVGAGMDREIVLGHDQHRRQVRVPLFARDGRAGVHTLVVGATGSGKTVTQTAMAVAAIERESAVIVIDPKGDRGMRDRLADAAAGAARPFAEWTPEGGCVYNPFESGGDTEVADKALAGERFT
jgi:hypothetical protein